MSVIWQQLANFFVQAWNLHWTQTHSWVDLWGFLSFFPKVLFPTINAMKGLGGGYEALALGIYLLLTLAVVWIAYLISRCVVNAVRSATGNIGSVLNLGLKVGMAIVILLFILGMVASLFTTQAQQGNPMTLGPGIEGEEYPLFAWLDDNEILTDSAIRQNLPATPLYFKVGEPTLSGGYTVIEVYWDKGVFRDESFDAENLSEHIRLWHILPRAEVGRWILTQINMDKPLSRGTRQAFGLSFLNLEAAMFASGINNPAGINGYDALQVMALEVYNFDDLLSCSQVEPLAPSSDAHLTALVFCYYREALSVKHRFVLLAGEGIAPEDADELIKLHKFINEKLIGIQYLDARITEHGVGKYNPTGIRSLNSVYQSFLALEAAIPYP